MDIIMYAIIDFIITFYKWWFIAIVIGVVITVIGNAISAISSIGSTNNNTNITDDNSSYRDESICDDREELLETFYKDGIEYKSEEDYLFAHWSW